MVPQWIQKVVERFLYTYPFQGPRKLWGLFYPLQKIWSDLITCPVFLFFSDHFLCLGRLGRKSCSHTMCKSNGNPKICILFHPQLWQASRSSPYGDQVLHWKVSPGFRPKSRYNSFMWIHASKCHSNWNLDFLFYDLVTGITKFVLHLSLMFQINFLIFLLLSYDTPPTPIHFLYQKEQLI